jgi:hypothetical protein
MATTTIISLIVLYQSYDALKQEPIESDNLATISNDVQFRQTFGYSLAKEQSFGFFTDISDENWKIAQKYHSSLFPNYYANLNKYSNGKRDKGKTKNLGRSNMWYGQVSEIKYDI